MSSASRLTLDAIYNSPGFDPQPLMNLQVLVPDSVDEWRLAIIHIDEVLNDVDGFQEAAKEKASQYNGIILMLDGYWIDKGTKYSIRRIGALDDFLQVPAIVKLFVEGVETQLERKVLHLGYALKSGYQWLSVPLDVKDRWPATGEDPLVPLTDTDAR